MEKTIRKANFPRSLARTILWCYATGQSPSANHERGVASSPQTHGSRAVGGKDQSSPILQTALTSWIQDHSELGGGRERWLQRCSYLKKAIKKSPIQIRAILAPSTAHESASAKIQALNWLIRGWCEYYHASGPPQTFGKLSNEIFWAMAHWLEEKYKRSMPAVMQKFREDNTFRTSARKLIMPREYKAKLSPKRKATPIPKQKKSKAKRQEEERESLFSYDKLWSGNDDRHERSDLKRRRRRYFPKGTICAIQGPDCISQGKPLHPSGGDESHNPSHKVQRPTGGRQYG